MNQRFLIMFIIAFGLAGGAAWIAKNWVEGLNAPQSEENKTPVVVAAIDIAYGAKIEAPQVKILNWSSDHIPKGAFTDIQQVVGKISQRAFVTDEVLLEPQIKDKAAGSILSAMIPDGKRAMSVPVNAVSGVAGFITPGNMVDIIATNNKTQKTYILLSNVKVLAIDQLASPTQDKPAIVTSLTLELSVEESTRLVKALQSGSFYFTLRNPKDVENTATELHLEVSEPLLNTTKIKPTVQTLNTKKLHQSPQSETVIINWPTSGVGLRQDDTKEGEK
jgi:pilus assembly protein CpaB